MNNCFLTPNVANRTEHITNLGRCEVGWLRIASSLCELSPFLSQKSNQVIQERNLPGLGRMVQKEKTIKTLKKSEG